MSVDGAGRPRPGAPTDADASGPIPVVGFDGDGGNVRLALRAPGLLRQFNDAGVLTAADVHVALRLGRLGSTGDDAALLAAALAVRAPRLGHVCVDLAVVRATVSADLDVPVDLRALPWPDPDTWVERLAASSLVGADRPLRLEGTALYLDRFWSEECQVAADLLERAGVPAEGVDLRLLADGLRRLFGPGEAIDLQRLAAAAAVLRRFSVIAGGPGTGKTTTVARVLALLDEQAEMSGRRQPLVALAAPTGKAAARLEEAVHGEAAHLPLSADARAHLLGLRGTTIHRLLGRSPASRTRFRHDRLSRLAHDVVVVDETSMVSLSLMARLVDAVRPDARLVLVGDPEQLASVEAGAVLGDLVGPAAHGLRMRPAARQALAAVSGQAVPASDPPEADAAAARFAAGSTDLESVFVGAVHPAPGPGVGGSSVGSVGPGGLGVTGASAGSVGPGVTGASAGSAGPGVGAAGPVGPGVGAVGSVGPAVGSVGSVEPGVSGAPAESAGPGWATPIGDGIIVLRRGHRFGAGIARLAEAIQGGDADGAITVLSEGDPDVCWLAVDVTSDDSDDAVGPVRSAVVAAGLRMIDTARTGRAADAIAALTAFRLLCAHRRGPAGVATWTDRVERWLADTVDGFATDAAWYIGRPVMVTANDPSLRLYNGDTGVVVEAAGGRVAAAFERGTGLVEVSPTRLGSVDTVYAMTIHKAQGSQFDEVAVVLPGPDSPILTRELLYTAVTRARRRLIIAGTADAIRAAADRPVARSSGLRRRLWGS
jgi:exodeoxyribonuclease V alpha subunit